MDRFGNSAQTKITCQFLISFLETIWPKYIPYQLWDKHEIGVQTVRWETELWQATLGLLKGCLRQLPPFQRWATPQPRPSNNWIQTTYFESWLAGISLPILCKWKLSHPSQWYTRAFLLRTNITTPTQNDDMMWESKTPNFNRLGLTDLKTDRQFSK